VTVLVQSRLVRVIVVAVVDCFPVANGFHVVVFVILLIVMRRFLSAVGLGTVRRRLPFGGRCAFAALATGATAAPAAFAARDFTGVQTGNRNLTFVDQFGVDDGFAVSVRFRLEVRKRLGLESDPIGSLLSSGLFISVSLLAGCGFSGIFRTPGSATAPTATFTRPALALGPFGGFTTIARGSVGLSAAKIVLQLFADRARRFGIGQVIFLLAGFPRRRLAA
jgi:hypothetical protein